MARADAEHVRDALLPLCEPLYRAFAAADAIRRERLPELADEPLYRWHTTHTVRAYAHHGLRRADLGRWELSGNHAHNGELWLTDSTYEARVLHAVSDLDVPAGPIYYRNLTLPVVTPLFGPADNRLLILWRMDERAGTPRFRVVRPVGDWRFGGHAQTDLDFTLPATASELSAARFELSDEGLELDIPAGDGDDGAG